MPVCYRDSYSWAPLEYVCVSMIPTQYSNVTTRHIVYHKGQHCDTLLSFIGSCYNYLAQLTQLAHLSHLCDSLTPYYRIKVIESNAIIISQ